MISHHSYPCFMLKCHKNPVKSPFFVVKYHHIPMRSLLFLGEIPRESAPTPRLHQLLHLSAARRFQRLRRLQRLRRQALLEQLHVVASEAP